MSDNNYPSDTGARDMIAELRSILGAKLVAYLARIEATDTINRWVEGTAPLPHRVVLDRFEVALTAAHLITTRDTPAAAQAWFQGCNPTLGDQPPAKILREAHLNSELDAVLAAAGEFATHSC